MIARMPSALGCDVGKLFSRTTSCEFVIGWEDGETIEWELDKRLACAAVDDNKLRWTYQQIIGPLMQQFSTHRYLDRATEKLAL